MFSSLVSWTFWALSVWFAFQLGIWWNERAVAESIAAITERQAKRRSLDSSEIVAPHFWKINLLIGEEIAGESNTNTHSKSGKTTTVETIV